MFYLKCKNCGHLNEVQSEYLIFCSSCDKKLDDNYSDWKKRNPDKTLDDFKQLICISKSDIQKTNTKTKTKPKGLKYWIGFAVAFAIFYAAGQLGGEKLLSIFKKPAYDKVLMNIASELNESCPIMVDNMTRLDNAITLPDKVFQYNYTIINLVKDSIDLDKIKSNLEPTITNYVKTNPDMQTMREYETTFKYSYKDMNGVFLFDITVKPEQYKE